MVNADDRGMQAMRDRAYVLAETGKFDNVHAVEQALIAEGWPNARIALDSSFARKAIGERCQAARAH